MNFEKRIEGFAKTEKLLEQINASIEKSGQADQKLWAEALTAIVQDSMKLAALVHDTSLEHAVKYSDANLKEFAEGMKRGLDRARRR